MIKYIIKLSLAALAIFLLLISWLLLQNNKTADPPQRVELDTGLNAAAGWLEQKQSSLIQIPNPILFWMIRQAWENTGNEKLGNFYRAFKSLKVDNQPKGLWTPFFDQGYRPHVPPIKRLENYRPYKLFFAYGLSCDTLLAAEPVIQRQMEPGFCKQHFLHPRCVTHQIMGLRFMQRYHCGYEDQVNATLASLQDTVVNELRWDFRVGDAYIQRVTMLIDCGATVRVKPVWVKRILEAQNDDGSWDDLYPVLILPGGKVFGLSSKMPRIQEITGNFHTTAQAVWMLSMLIRNHTD